MKKRLSLVMITKNSQDTIEKSLQSTQGLVDEIIIVDDRSSDQTVKIAKQYGAAVFTRSDEDLGKQKAFGIGKARGEWILVLDADEYLSEALRKEIDTVVSQSAGIEGYTVPYQNYFLGKPLRYGGENYRMLRLFKKNSVEIEPNLVHEHAVLKKGRQWGYLKNKIHHHSYRSFFQMYSKFTGYAIREAKRKIKNGEKSSLKKIVLYPPHMFWARFIKDKGYKDGFLRIFLDAGFAYMELVTYVSMLFMR